MSAEQQDDRGVRIPALDGVRGLAVAFVLFSHMSFLGLRPHPALSLAGAGVYGVYLFFVLSAYLLTRGFLAQAPPRPMGVRNWGAYAFRRFFRIYPLYALVLVVAWWSPTVATGAFGDRPVTLLEHLALLRGEGYLWAIPVEVKFYFVLPFILAAVEWLRRFTDSSGVLLCAGLLVLAIPHAPARPLAPEMASVELLPRLAPFLFGALAAYLDQATRAWRPRKLAGAALSFSALLVLGAVLATVPTFWSRLSGTPVPFNAFHAHTVQFGAGWSLFVFAVMRGDHLLARVFEISALRWLGRVSFSVYLWHLPVLYGLLKYAGMKSSLVWFVAALAAVLATAALSHAAVEAPMMRLGASLARRTANRAAQT